MFVEWPKLRWIAVMRRLLLAHGEPGSRRRAKQRTRRTCGRSSNTTASSATTATRTRRGWRWTRCRWNCPPRPRPVSGRRCSTSSTPARCRRRRRNSRSPARRERSLQFLGGALHDASLARQQAQGRVPLRRLSRTQYEDTLRDLLALPALNVKDLLPEESPVAGFDNVSSGQSISGVHLVRYQQAADAALAAAVPSRAFRAGPHQPDRTGADGGDKEAQGI